MLEFGFNKLRLRRIYAGVFYGNLPSQKSLIKFGFRKEGLSKKSIRTKSTKKIHDALHFGLLKEEWSKK